MRSSCDVWPRATLGATFYRNAFLLANFEHLWYSMPTSNLSIMPITKGAEKALRQSKRKQVFNVRRKNAMKEVVKEVQKAAAAGDVTKAKELLPKAYKAIDKAAKRGVIKDNTADRKKSRLTARVKAAK